MTAEDVKEKRNKLNMTQQQLADALGVHRVTVSNWETNAAPIDRAVELAIEHLGCKARAHRRVK